MAKNIREEGETAKKSSQIWPNKLGREKNEFKNKE